MILVGRYCRYSEWNKMACIRIMGTFQDSMGKARRIIMEYYQCQNRSKSTKPLKFRTGLESISKLVTSNESYDLILKALHVLLLLFWIFSWSLYIMIHILLEYQGWFKYVCALHILNKLGLFKSWKRRISRRLSWISILLLVRPIVYSAMSLVITI